MDIESEIKKVLESKEASYRIEKNNEKFVISVKAGSELIQRLDVLFNSGRLSHVESAVIKSGDAIPPINIDGYFISPAVFKPEKEIKNNVHIYNFDYVVQKNS